MTIREKLLEIGCTEVNNKIYISEEKHLKAVFGLEFTYTKWGKEMNGAFLNGEKLRKRDVAALLYYEPYYDCVKCKFVASLEPIGEFKE